MENESFHTTMFFLNENEFISPAEFIIEFPYNNVLLKLYVKTVFIIVYSKSSFHTTMFFLNAYWKQQNNENLWDWFPYNNVLLKQIK